MSPFAYIELPLRFLLHLYILTYHFLVPRENCRKRLNICVLVAFGLQVLVRCCMLSDTPWIAEYNIAKLLTILMICLVVFWGGSCVYGGWAQEIGRAPV